MRFFKRDHPRAIDHYIDYFGGRTDAGREARRLLELLLQASAAPPVAVPVRSAS
jgi:hypothetical protein